MLASDMRTDLSRRKFPRVFHIAKNGPGAPLQNIELIWADRNTSQILDISEAGILVPSTSLVGKVKIGQSLDVHLRVNNNEPKQVQVRVLRLTAQVVSLALDSLNVQSRLKIDQEDREQLIQNSWRKLGAKTLPAAYVDCEWWHASFDTNLWLWRDPSGRPHRYILEFESLALISDGGVERQLKAPAAFDENRGYLGPLLDPLPNKVEAGCNWRERLQKIFSSNTIPGMLWSELQVDAGHSHELLLDV